MFKSNSDNESYQILQQVGQDSSKVLLLILYKNLNNIYFQYFTYFSRANRLFEYKNKLNGTRLFAVEIRFAKIIGSRKLQCIFCS